MIGEFRTWERRVLDEQNAAMHQRQTELLEQHGWFTPSQIRALEALYPLPAYIPTPEEYRGAGCTCARAGLCSICRRATGIEAAAACVPLARVTLYPGSGEEPPDYADGPRIADPDADNE